MGINFKETAHLKTNTKIFEENFSKIDWGNSEKNDDRVESIKVQTIHIENDLENEIEELAKKVFNEVNHENFVDNSSWIFGFVEGYKKALEVL